MVVVYKDRVYLPAGQFIYCIDMEDGRVIWGRKDQSIGFYGTPTIAEGKIFYGNRRGFYARELLNGHLVWDNPGIYTYGGFPSYWNGMVYTVSKEFQKESARLIGLDAVDGSIQWQAVLENVSNIYSPVVYRERIYLAFGNQLGVFDAATGEKLWEKVFIAPVASHPVFSHGYIYLSLLEGTILRIDPENGRWAPLFSVPYATQFAVVGSYLYIPVKVPHGEVAVVDATNGLELRRITTGEGEPSALTVSRGIALVSSSKGLVAVGKGSFLGTVSAPGGYGRGSAAGTDGFSDQWGRAGEIAEAGSDTGEADRGVGRRSRAAGDGDSSIIQGEVREKYTGSPLDGTVEATTTFGDGSIAHREEGFRDGFFEIEVPREGETDLLISSPGFTFETITLPDAKAVDDLSLEGIEVSLSRARQGERISVDTIHFETGKANLETGSIPTMQKLKEMLQDNPGIRIEIAGHTDSTGSEETNQRLSELRAESVANWLIQNGVSSTRISTAGYGESRPVADNTTEEGRRKNRRTEISIFD
jgi:outer membrane protein OmpA-like peptidoglycan-associated protein